MTSNPIREIREALGESQAAFAKRLGINLRTVRRYEAGATLPASEAVMRQVRALAEEHGIKLP